jgi:hypothetical protein
LPTHQRRFQHTTSTSIGTDSDSVALNLRTTWIESRFMINARTIVIMAAMTAARTAAAQETRGYIGGGTMLSWQGAGTTC